MGLRPYFVMLVLICSICGSGTAQNPGNGAPPLSNPLRVALLKWYPANESGISYPTGMGPTHLPAVPRPLAILFLLIVATVASGQYQIVHSFMGGTDGEGAWSSLIMDKNGNLYGTTTGGGDHGLGTVFEFSPDGKGGWTETVLHSFNGSDGEASTAGMVVDPQGNNLYGTTSEGGANRLGTVFELTPGSNGWIETTLYNFCSLQDCEDGAAPYSGLVIGRDGTLYGTAPYASSNDGGVVFDLTPGFNGWTESVIHRFSSPTDGGRPFAGLVQDEAGNLYGATEGGGLYKTGIVYELHKTSGGAWQELILHNFGSFPFDGQVPGLGELVFDNSGSLYGTTAQGGSNICVDVGCGTIFRLTPGAPGMWTETILYNFKNPITGFGPGAGVALDEKGNLYGTTVYGGRACDCGVIYELSPVSPVAAGKYIVLHSFTGFDGAQPDANPILDSYGNLYGTTATGGGSGLGVIFEISR